MLQLTILFLVQIVFYLPPNTDPIIAVIKEEDTYEELKKGYTGLYPDPSSITSGLTHTGTAMTHAGTAMTPAPPRVTVNAGTSPIWRNVRAFIGFFVQHAFIAIYNVSFNKK